MARRRKPETNRAPDVRTSDGGPTRWLLPFLEARYLRLQPKHSDHPAEQEEHEREHLKREQVAIDNLVMGKRMGPLVPRDGKPGFRSLLQPGREDEALVELPSTYWHDLTKQYRARQLDARRTAGARFNARVHFEQGPVAQPGIAGASNWVPIGPSVVRRGQPSGRPAISGRANGIAIAPGGVRVFVATADGGVWRSDNGGASWYSTMDNFDVDPTTFAVTSLACGAIAIDPADPNRVYVVPARGTRTLSSPRVSQARFPPTGASVRYEATTVVRPGTRSPPRPDRRPLWAVRSMRSPSIPETARTWSPPRAAVCTDASPTGAAGTTGF